MEQILEVGLLIILEEEEKETTTVEDLISITAEEEVKVMEEVKDSSNSFSINQN